MRDAECDAEADKRFNRKLADFVKALYKIQEELKEKKVEFSYAKLNGWADPIWILDNQWQRILGAAEVIGITEEGLKVRRVKMEGDKRLDKEHDIWFRCSYKHHI